jgi:antitoxin component YwqK of YwqJK toxin-antitoxin module
MERIDITDVEFNDDYSYRHHGVLFTGIAYELSPEGTLISEITFAHGIMEGPSHQWYPTGEKHADCNYHHNALHGSGNEWFTSGRQKRHTLHELGILVESDEWDEDGSLVSTFRLKEDDFNYKLLGMLRLAKWQPPIGEGSSASAGC